MESHLRSFRPAFDDLLASSGDADVADLAGRFDLDIRREQFWKSSLDMIRRDIDTFVDVADRRLGLATPQV
jgi:oligoendopeptidase F